MKGTYWIPLAAVALIGCSSGGSLGVKGDASSGGSNGYTFTYKPKVGDNATYAMKISGTAAGQPINMDGTVSVKVTDAGSGNVNVESVETGVGGTHTTIETVDPSGKVVKSSLDGKPTPGASSGASTRDIFPSHPVKVGESWSGNRTVQGKSVNADYKLDKVDTVGGVQVATIELTKLDMDGIKLNEPATIVMEPATGILHSMKMAMSQTVQGQTVSTTITMEKK